jgi:hypothetical protein
VAVATAEALSSAVAAAPPSAVTESSLAGARQAAAPAAAVAAAVPVEPDPDSPPDTPPAADPSLPGFVSHQALRVAFNPESDEFGQLVVRPLIEGEEAPARWVTALLVGLEAGKVVLAGAE